MTHPKTINGKPKALAQEIMGHNRHIRRAFKDIINRQKRVNNILNALHRRINGERDIVAWEMLNRINIDPVRFQNIEAQYKALTESCAILIREIRMIEGDRY